MTFHRNCPNSRLNQTMVPHNTHTDKTRRLTRLGEQFIVHINSLKGKVVCDVCAKNRQLLFSILLRALSTVETLRDTKKKLLLAGDSDDRLPFWWSDDLNAGGKTKKMAREVKWQKLLH